MNTLFTPDKPFKTYQEMVAYLQDFHHLACLDPAWDASVLQLVPYYDLINGYYVVSITPKVPLPSVRIV